MTTVLAKDLSKEAPRSPYDRLGGYAILPRTIDKCRATVAGTAGEYHFDCPVDKTLFAFTGVNAADFKAAIEAGHTDDEILAWIGSKGTPHTAAEITAWSDKWKTDFSYHTDPEKKDWFDGECKRLGIDPATNSLFDLLVVDDKASFTK